jgi:4-aminobutyrate aminotransferase-like enzyme
LFARAAILTLPCRRRGIATTAEALVALGQKHVNKGVPKLVQDVFEKGSGSWVTMLSGKKYLDFTSGIGVTNLGAWFVQPGAGSFY